jgi:outer membrane protein insertion porin family
MAQDLTLVPDLGTLADTTLELPYFKERTISSITIEGNNLVSSETILSKVPYAVGDTFRAFKSAEMIQLLFALGYFKNIQLFAEDSSESQVDLFIVVDEKKRLEKIVIENNKHLSYEEIEKKFKLSEIITLDEQGLESLSLQIKKLYSEKDYHNVILETRLEEVDPQTVRAHITVQEGKKTHVKRVFFKGNCAISESLLRSLTFTREDWLLGFLDKAGSYQKEALDFDKYTIENYYQNNGFLAAQVTEIVTEKEPREKSNDVYVTFNIDEGELYRVSAVRAPGNDIFTEEELLQVIPIRPGELYSKEKIRNTMETLRILWGEKGYIYAEIEPSVVPDMENKTVEIEFVSSLGDQVFVNRINIQGNRKTRDHIIRRLIKFNEGDLLTASKLEFAKNSTEATGFFDPKNGVNWKIVRLDEDKADVNLILKERPTGRFNAQIGFGGSDTNIQSPTTTFNVGMNLADINAWGTGVSYNFSLNYSAQDRSFNFDVFSPWIFNRPIGIGSNIVLRKMTYEEFRQVSQKPTESIFGGSGILRFLIPQFNFINTQIEVGAQRINYNTITAQVMNRDPLANTVFQNVLNNLFVSGNLIWLNMSFAQDFRNNPVFPSRGYQWVTSLRFGLPHQKNDFGFVKLEADAQWLTPLINEYDLILKLHGFLGLTHIFNGYTVPYKELFHIGGPATVRGFEFGQIGPQIFDNSLGGKKAFVFNAELLFPVTADQSIKGVLFYDGGAGWDTPNPAIAQPYLRNNSFDFRHAIGFGIRVTKPTPVRVDVGFKLDRRKRDGEPASRIHFGMNQEF